MNNFLCQVPETADLPHLQAGCVEGSLGGCRRQSGQPTAATAAAAAARADVVPAADGRAQEQS